MTITTKENKNIKNTTTTYQCESVSLPEDISLLSVYLTSIKGCTGVSHIQEQILGKKIKAGNRAEEVLISQSSKLSIKQKENLKNFIETGQRAKEKLAKKNLKLVVYLANKWRTFGLDLMDLIQDGNEALYDAASKFDYTKGVRFATYASKCIVGHLQRIINTQKKLGKVSEKNVQLINKAKKAYSEISVAKGRKATKNEIALFLDMEISDYDELMKLDKQETSVYLPVNNDDMLDTNIIDTLEDKKAVMPENQSLKNEKIQLVDKALNSLTNKEKLLIKSLFGFNNKNIEATLTDVAKDLGISVEAVRQRRERILKKLRNLEAVKNY